MKDLRIPIAIGRGFELDFTGNKMKWPKIIALFANFAVNFLSIRVKCLPGERNEAKFSREKVISLIIKKFAMKRICLITHCEASHSTEGKVGGWYDSELTDFGKLQASQLSSKIGNMGFDIPNLTVYSSDLRRAAQTSQILTNGTHTQPILDQRLREMSFGTHGGMNQHEHNQIMTPTSPNGNRLDHRICTGAESRRNVAERTYEFVNEIMELDDDKIVVTHGFAASFFIAAFQKIDISSMGYINYKLKPGSISILEEDNLFYNTTVSLLNG